MANQIEQNQVVNWNELIKQNPREVILSGKDIDKQIKQENGLNKLIYKLKNVNFLEISKAPSLTIIEPSISDLSNLTNLVLEDNQLKCVPDELCKLTKLKCLNLCRNQIEMLPDGLFDEFCSLQTLNVEQNKLTRLPNMSKLSSLLSLKCASNQLTEFPSSLCNGIYKDELLSSQSSMPIYHGGAVHLVEFDASHNQISELPSTIERLVTLKSFNMSYNQLNVIPTQLANCQKLKDVNLKENPLKDRRLYKLIEQCPTKKILDYLRNRQKSISSSSSTDPVGNIVPTTSSEDSFKGKTIQPKFTITIRHNHKEKFKVIASKLIIGQRKIVACIIHQVDLSNPKLLKRFLAIQTKLHQGICDNRQKATIATHDYSKVITAEASYASKVTNSTADNQTTQPPPRAVFFEGRVPTKIRLKPLGRSGQMTALELYRLLNDEADQYRKEKKRSTISGIHKYIHLLKGKQLYPVLLDANQTVLSLPPLTNAEFSKVETNTKSIFVEVTGESIPTCRQVMNELIYSLICATYHDDDCEGSNSIKLFPNDQMIIEPVIVEMGETHELLVKYPAKIDLQYEAVQVVLDDSLDE